MKNLFRFIAIALIGAVAMVVSCAPGEDPVTPQPAPGGDPTLAVTTPELQIGASDQIVYRQITVQATNSTEAWEIASTPEWITTTDVTATGFDIAIEPYIDGEAPAREGTIVIEMGELSADVVLTQLVYMIPYVLTVTPEEIPSALPDQFYAVEVTASHAWEVDTAAEWITIGDETTGGFNIAVAEYGDAPGTERTGVVTVSSRDTECEITVTQLKPYPDAIPLADYLGEYTITAKQGSNMNSSMPGYFEGTRPFQATGTMRVSDLGPNWVSINVLGSNLYFTYDPTTGVLKNNNYVAGNWACTFGHFTRHQLNDWNPPSNIFFAFDEGSMSFEIDESGKIVVPETVYVPSNIVNVGGLNVEVGGLDKSIAICQFSLQHHITWSDYIIDITFTKNNP